MLDQHLRTSATNIFAAGDVTGGPQFTHYAGWQCFQAVRNALLPGSAKGTSDVIPAVTFIDPEIAHVGLSEADARAKLGDEVRVHQWEMAHADRPVCDGEPEGFVKVVTRGKGVIVGATMVASRAGEMIQELALAVQRKLTLSDVAATMHAYPTWSMAVQQLASEVAVADFLGGTTGKLALDLARWVR